jgi:hypothetical protein
MYDILWKSKCDLGYRCASSIGQVQIKLRSQFFLCLFGGFGFYSSRVKSRQADAKIII